MIDGLSAQVALVDHDGIITTINRHWRREIQRQGNWDFDLGCHYGGALAGLVEAGDLRVAPVLQAFRDISHGVRRSFSHLYIGSGRFEGHDYKVSISALQLADDAYVIVSVEDVSELNALRRQRRRTDTQVLRAQEAERRRMARELHDSTQQQLVLLQLSLMNLGARATQHQKELISDCQRVVKDVQREIRSFSFLAHPPTLSDTDLVVALEKLTTGFASRIGLNIDFDTSNVRHASASAEAAIYRVAQEALSNIHRHASAKHAAVRLIGTDRCLHLVISDDGIGFGGGGQNSMGVGVVGMRERIRELGGRFSITRLDQGTLLRVSLPLRRPESRR